MLWAALIVLAALLAFNLAYLLWTVVPHAPESTGNVVKLTILAAPESCVACRDPNLLVQELEGSGIVIGEKTVVAPESFRGRRLASNYDLTKLPALVFSEELATYPEIASAWSRVGTVASDGSYILQGFLPPFYDLEQEKVRGEATLTLLTDPTCAECYDPAVHQDIFEQMGVALSDVKIVDITSDEGKALQQRYAITAVPTAILSGELSLYNGFTQIWTSVGTAEEGDVYVFRKVELIGEPYKDLTTGKVVTPALVQE